MLNTISMADSYFATNAFGSDVWGALTDERKTTLLTTAENDVNAYLGTTDAAEAINATAPFTVYQMAVFEWALYIEKNQELLEAVLERSTSGVSAVEVDNIGREEYVAAQNYSGASSAAYMQALKYSRAGQFLAALPKSLTITR